MEGINPAAFNLKVAYNGKDITEDLTQHLLDFTYTDNISGVADDLDIMVEDADEKWSNAWYPGKGAELTINFGYAGGQ